MKGNFSATVKQGNKIYFVNEQICHGFVELSCRNARARKIPVIWFSREKEIHLWKGFTLR
jgi:hypothetical protein